MISAVYSYVFFFLGEGLAEASGSRSNSSLIDPEEMLQAVESDESLWPWPQISCNLDLIFSWDCKLI